MANHDNDHGKNKDADHVNDLKAPENAEPVEENLAGPSGSGTATPEQLVKNFQDGFKTIQKADGWSTVRR